LTLEFEDLGLEPQQFKNVGAVDRHVDLTCVVHKDIVVGAGVDTGRSSGPKSLHGNLLLWMVFLFAGLLAHVPLSKEQKSTKGGKHSPFLVQNTPFLTNLIQEKVYFEFSL